MQAKRIYNKQMQLDLSKKLVVWDCSGPFATENQTFDRKIIKQKWYVLSGPDFYDLCLANGIQLITTDLYFSLAQKPKNVIFVRDGTGKNRAAELMRAGVHPAVFITPEHPLYAPQIYFNLKKITQDYDYTFIPEGARSLLSPKTTFVNWRGLHAYRKQISKVEYAWPKKYLVLINGNSRIHRLKRWYTNIMNIVRPLPTFVNRELYVDRLNAIKYFSKDADFDLYGHSWDRPVRYTHGEYDHAIKTSYRGEVDDKFSVMQQYRFTICFENAIFKGWITEKITDAMYAGCVPVYWGAPNITDYVPENAFIDFRKFKNYAELDHFLRNMDEKTYRGYIDGINEFIKSDGAYQLSQEKFFDDLITIFKKY